MSVRKRDLFNAMRGDQSAMRAIARQALRNYHEKLNELDDERDYHERETWNPDAQREWALNPETSVDPEAFESVWNLLNHKLLTLILGVVMLLFGDPQASEQAEDRIRETAFDLFLIAGNPEVRYNLIAGLDPELREIADEQLTDFGREAWYSLLALTEDEVDLDKFPPDAAANIRALAEQRAEVLEAEAEGADD